MKTHWRKIEGWMVVMVLFMAVAALFYCGLAHGQELSLDETVAAPPAGAPNLDAVGGILDALAGKYGWIVTALTIIGGLRFCLKPLFALIEAIIGVTPTQRDDEYWAAVKRSKAMTWVLWVLDWLASVKRPGAVVNPVVKLDQK